MGSTAGSRRSLPSQRWGHTSCIVSSSKASRRCSRGVAPASGRRPIETSGTKPRPIRARPTYGDGVFACTTRSGMSGALPDVSLPALPSPRQLLLRCSRLLAPGAVLPPASCRCTSGFHAVVSPSRGRGDHCDSLHPGKGATGLQGLAPWYSTASRLRRKQPGPGGGR